MTEPKTAHFDISAAAWDAEPRRVELAKAVGEAILRQVQPTREMDVLDYGCGTGLLGLFLLPHVRSVTGADSSPGMLEVLERKIRSGGMQMRALKLDLLNDPPPESHYNMITANMVLHHVERIDVLLAAFHRMLLPGGILAVSDLDAEQGLFHGPEAAGSVYHNGFDRRKLMDRLRSAGFVDVKDTTAHVTRKPIAGGEIHEFPVFLIVGRRE